MPLTTPLIVGPLTEWSANILVEGCFPGATVLLRAIGPGPRDLAKQVVGGGSDRVALLPGETLQPGDNILVMQRLGADQSAWTPDRLAVPVGKAPAAHADLAPLAFRSRVWQCGERIWVQGAVPGAQVTVSGSSGILATGRATESGDARLALTASLPGPGQTVTARQDAPPGFAALAGAPVTTSATVEAIPVPFQEKLPTPALIGDPPKGCDPSMGIGSVFDGATVTIARASDGTSESSVFDLDRLNYIFLKPLGPSSDTLEIVQSLPRCRQWPPSDPLRVPVAAAAKPGVPMIRPPCADSVDVYVENLEPGALVTLTYQGQEYRGMAPPTGTTFVFRLTPLVAQETIAVRQERCGLVSDTASTTVPGISSSATVPPDVVEPLYACAGAVRVTTIPGAWLQVWAKTPSGAVPIGAQVLASADSVRIRVTPYLHELTEVWVAYLLCGSGAWDESRHHTVQATPEVGPANLPTPLVEADTSVAVDAIPGAWVNVFAMRGPPFTVEHIGGDFVDPLVKSVPLYRPLTQRDLVFAEQRLCHGRPGVGAARSVLPAVREFHLVLPLSQLSHENDPKPVVCSTASVVCRHSGGWEFTAHVENKEPKADCSLDVQFDLSGVSPPFGAVVSSDLSAPGSSAGLSLYGVPSQRTLTRPGTFTGFQNPSYWESVLGATGKFSLIAAFENYAPTPEAPDSPDD
ncbi:MAG: hypothetical protein IT305_11710 [Chloroflexi bacterium]|nr:hypothetical protein [Chloroflexota bacterium]